MATRTRHSGMVQTARHRDWQLLVALALELLACDVLDVVEHSEVVAAAVWLAERIWPDGRMATRTWALCYGL